MQLHHSRKKRITGKDGESSGKRAGPALLHCSSGWSRLGGVYETDKQADVNSKSALQLAQLLLPPAIESVQNYSIEEKKSSK